MRAMSRRSLLSGLTALGAALAFRHAGPAQAETALRAALRADPSLARTVAQLGQACAPLEADFGAAEMADLERGYRSAAAAGIPVARWIDDMVRRDFRERAVVSAGGWILARSEVGLFLYARRLAA